MSGIVAGAVATGVMSLVMLGAKRVGAVGELPPRRLTRLLLSPLGRAAPRGKALDTAATLAHFGFGATLGGLFSLLPPRAQTHGTGMLFGLAVWTTSYAGWLPKAGLMPPPSRDRPGRPTAMIASHLVFGAVLAAAQRRLWSNPSALRDKVVVVCGGSRGLGRAVARELVRHGARVAICGRTREPLEQTQAWLETFGAPVLAEVCDLRRDGQTTAFFRRVTRELGPIDVVVANAATIEVGPIEALMPLDFEAAMSEIFGTAMRAALAVLPDMRGRRRGTIAFITSLGGRVGVPHLAPYSAAKFAEVGFAEALQAEVAKDGIRVLTVMPGLMRTGSHLHATFRGRRTGELAWFGACAVAPLLSIDADRAARHVVRAIARQDRFLMFTPAAHFAAWLHDTMPNTWSLLVSLVARLLPRAPADDRRFDSSEGGELAQGSSSAIVKLIAARSARLAARHGQ